MESWPWRAGSRPASRSSCWLLGGDRGVGSTGRDIRGADGGGDSAAGAGGWAAPSCPRTACYTSYRVLGEIQPIHVCSENRSPSRRRYGPELPRWIPIDALVSPSYRSVDPIVHYPHSQHTRTVHSRHSHCLRLMNSYNQALIPRGDRRWCKCDYPSYISYNHWRNSLFTPNGSGRYRSTARSKLAVDDQINLI